MFEALIIVRLYTFQIQQWWWDTKHEYIYYEFVHFHMGNYSTANFPMYVGSALISNENYTRNALASADDSREYSDYGFH